MKNPYIIAEIGINHNGRINDIKKLIYSAKKSGANAVKFQLFKAETLASKDSNIKSLYKKKKRNSISNVEKVGNFNFQIIINKKITSKIKIDLIFSVFDDHSINQIKNSKPKFVKIASSDITDLTLLKKINSIKKQRLSYQLECQIKKRYQMR